MLDSEYRRRSLFYRLNAIWAEIDSLNSQQELLASNTKAFLQDLEGAIIAITQGFERRYDLAGRAIPEDCEDDRRDLCDELRDVIQSIDSQLMPVARGASSTIVPVEYERLLCEMAALFGDSVTTVVLSSKESLGYNISKLGSLRGVAKSFVDEDIVELSASNYVAASAPRALRDAACLHAVLIGHELGHLLEWKTSLSSKLGRPPTPSEYQENPDPFAAALEALYVRVASSWTTELEADLVSVLLLGPAAVLAMFEHTNDLSSFDADILTHPAGNRRVAFMFSGFSAHLNNDFCVPGQPCGDALLVCRAETEGALDAPLRLAEPKSGAERDAYTSIQEGPVQYALDWVRANAPKLIPLVVDAVGIDSLHTRSSRRYWRCDRCPFAGSPTSTRPSNADGGRRCNSKCRLGYESDPGRPSADS